MNKKYIPIIYTAIIGIILFGGLAIYLHEPPFFGKKEPVPEHLKLKTTPDKILHHQIVRDIRIINQETLETMDYGDIIKYLWISDIEVPQQEINIKGQIIKEDMSKRLKNVQVFKIKENEYRGIFYTGEPFYRNISQDKWYQTETATTTIEAFDIQTKISWRDKLRGETALAAIDTFYAGAGDGIAEYWTGTAEGWDTPHDSVNGTNATYADTTQFWHAEEALSTKFWISRIFTPFYTGGTISAGAVIASSTYYFTTHTDVTAANDTLRLVQTTQASSTILAVTDYNECGATNTPAELSDDQPTPSTAATQYTFALNTAGKAVIKGSGETSNCGTVTGYTCLGIRAGRDADDTTPSARYYGQVRFSEYAGTGSDPRLEVDWSIAPAPEVEEVFQEMINFE